jgi:rod shape-determining protein MreC
VKFRRYGLLITVLLVCLVLLTVQTRGGGTGKAADLVSILTTPAQVVLTRIHRTAVGLWGSYREWRVSWSENSELRAENERLRVQSLQVTETRDENDRLRRLLGLRERLPITTMSGEVIGREGGGWVRALTVNRGIGEGIATQTPVIVPDGLVGRVVRVRPGASVVQLLNDPASTVGAMVQRTRTPGLVEGDPGGSVRFKFMARDGAGIVVGDTVVTSGQGNVFPKGLPVGRVIAIEDKGSALFHFAVLAPVVDFARVEEVLLLTGQTTQDLAGLFPRQES